MKNKEQETVKKIRKYKLGSPEDSQILPWLRDLCIEAKRQNRLDEALSECDIVNIVEESDMDQPFEQAYDMSEDYGRDNACRAYGRKLGHAFRESDEILIDIDGYITVRGFVITRINTNNDKQFPCRRYVIRYVSQEKLVDHYFSAPEIKKRLKIKKRLERKRYRFLYVCVACAVFGVFIGWFLGNML